MVKILAEQGNEMYTIEMACGHPGIYESVSHGRGDPAIIRSDMEEVAKEECRACQVKRRRAERNR